MAGAAAASSGVRAQVRLADESDRTAFRSWFVLLADAQFEQRAREVTDCAALVRYAFREALRAHTAEWARRVALPFTPSFPDVRSAPVPTPDGWPLFRTAEAPRRRYGEFADAKTIVGLNARPLGRDTSALAPGDLLYFRDPQSAVRDPQPAIRDPQSANRDPQSAVRDPQSAVRDPQSAVRIPQPDHLMVFVGPSFFDADARDWVVYHTGPMEDGPGEVRKVRLADLARHPSPRWRPHSSNPRFVGVFRLAIL